MGGLEKPRIERGASGKSILSLARTNAHNILPSEYPSLLYDDPTSPAYPPLVHLCLLQQPIQQPISPAPSQPASHTQPSHTIPHALLEHLPLLPRLSKIPTEYKKYFQHYSPPPIIPNSTSKATTFEGYASSKGNDLDNQLKGRKSNAQLQRRATHHRK